MDHQKHIPRAEQHNRHGNENRREDQKEKKSGPHAEHPERDNRDDRERKIDEQLDQTFPASDPPSYSQPGNDLDEG